MGAANFRDVAAALGLEPGASADACLAAVEALKAQAAAPAPVVEHLGYPPGTCLALVRISAGEASIERGQPLPFDPTRPPEGFDGFVEGVHYRRAS